MGTIDSKLALERLRVREQRREELRSVSDDERSELVEREAQERVNGPSSSTPAPAKGLVAVLNTLPAWSRVVVVLALLAVVALAITRGMRLW